MRRNWNTQRHSERSIKPKAFLNDCCDLLGIVCHVLCVACLIMRVGPWARRYRCIMFIHFMLDCGFPQQCFYAGNTLWRIFSEVLITRLALLLFLAFSLELARSQILLFPLLLNDRESLDLEVFVACKSQLHILLVNLAHRVLVFPLASAQYSSAIAHYLKN